MRVARFIAMLLLILGFAVGLTACGGDDGEADDGAVTEQTDANGVAEEADGEATDDQGEGPDASVEGDDEELGAARSEQIDELLTLHPVFTTRRFLNFAAHGNPGACSLLSDVGRQAMQEAHGQSCPDTIRTAAAGRDEPGLTIAGEFVPVAEFSDLEFPTTIYVFEREQGRVTVGDEPHPLILRQYGRIWLVDSVPLADIGTEG